MKTKFCTEHQFLPVTLSEHYDGQFIMAENWPINLCVKCGYIKIKMNYIVFTHSFAKMLWGREKGYVVNGNEWVSVPDSNCEMEIWQFHLMQLAISENRRQYLKKFIINEN